MESVDFRIKKMVENGESFFSALPTEKYKIRGRARVEMKRFISFLTVPVKKTDDHLGADAGWTEYINADLNLTISGGIVGGVEYLDSLKFGENLANPYNNYVNPFYLFKIFNDAGKAFFFDFYKKEIAEIVNYFPDKLRAKRDELIALEEEQKKVENEIEEICNGLKLYVKVAGVKDD